MRIWTSSWFTLLPPTIAKIGISRGTPRGYPAGYRRLPELQPGAWFNSVSPDEYHRLFMAHLASLDARAIMLKIAALTCRYSPLSYQPLHCTFSLAAGISANGSFSAFFGGYLGHNGRAGLPARSAPFDP